MLWVLFERFIPRKVLKKLLKLLKKAAWSVTSGCQILIDDHEQIGQLIDKDNKVTIDDALDLLDTDDEIPLKSAFTSMPLQLPTFKK